MIDQLEHATVGDIVARDYRAAGVFQRHGIDFCCGGRKPLAEAAEAKGIAVTVIVSELQRLDGAPAVAVENGTCAELIAHIVERHHGYLRTAMPTISAYLAKLVDVHGERHPELATIAGRFRDVRDELESHMYKEEQILFPLIEQVERADTGRAASPSGPPVAGIVEVMETEHTSAGVALADMRAASHDYTVPDDGCATYRACYQALAEFESDLHRHIHLENNVLFPRATEIDDRVRGF